MSRYEEVATMFSDSINSNPIRNAACQWVAEHEVDIGEVETLDKSEPEAYRMDAANLVAYIDLCYPGGSEAFIGDQA